MTPRYLLPALLLVALTIPVGAGEPKQPAAKELQSFQIPYTLTDTQHVMVRVKINGKGPYNFIVDTGAPLLYVSVPIAKKLDLKDEKKIAVLDTFEIEGGAKLTKIKALIDTPFQLEGMNAMGLPGVELHGIMGYSLLAHYKMEIDLGKNKMTWTRLDFAPPQPKPLGVKDKEVESLNALGPMMKAMAVLMGKKALPTPALRGFVGMALEERNGKVVVKSILENSPAAGKLTAGDALLEVQGKSVKTIADVMRETARLAAGDTLSFVVQAADQKNKKEITLTAGEGL